MKKSLSHTVLERKNHIVWVAKKRCKIIYGKLRQEVRTILKRLCKYKSMEVIAGNMCIDHIHICLAIPPKYSVSTIVGYLKGKSAMIVFEKYSRLKRNFKGHSFRRVDIMLVQLAWTKPRFGNTSRIRKSMSPSKINMTMI